MISWFEPNFIETFLWESVFFKFSLKSKWCEIKFGYLAAILKQYKTFIFFSWNMVVINVYTYGVNMI